MNLKSSLQIVTFEFIFIISFEVNESPSSSHSIVSDRTPFRLFLHHVREYPIILILCLWASYYSGIMLAKTVTYNSQNYAGTLGAGLDWSSLWLLNLNFHKCKVMHIGSTPHSYYYVSNLAISGNSTSLSEVTYGKDLGIWTTNKMEPSLHCHKAMTSANKILGMIRRTFVSMSKYLFVFLYRTYVRPYLEYCVQLWCPYLAKDIDMLEKVWMRSTKLVKGIGRLPYTIRLQKLGLHLLYCQREWGDLIETYKILKGYYDNEWSHKPIKHQGSLYETLEEAIKNNA